MKHFYKALPVLLTTLLCAFSPQQASAMDVYTEASACAETILSPYKKTSTQTKWVIAALAAIAANRWAANRAAYSSSQHEIGRILYELSQLKNNNVKKMSLSAEDLEALRLRLEEELVTQTQLKNGASNRCWLWGIPALVLICMTVRNISGWHHARAKKIKDAEDAEAQAERDEASKMSGAKAAPPAAGTDSSSAGSSDAGGRAAQGHSDQPHEALMFPFPSNRT